MLTSDQMQLILSRYHRTEIDVLPDGFRRASVLVLILDSKDGPELLLTRRTHRVNSHKGQVAFPGGAEDPMDGSSEQTALRETQEETGIPADRIQILGRLNDRLTISDFVVTPVCGWIRDPDPGWLTVTNEEIDRMFTVPLTWLSDPERVRVEQWERQKFITRMYFWRYDNEVIWGMTGLVIAELIDVLMGDGRLSGLTPEPSTMETFLKSVSR
ncbi:MAG: CoA pyrophosphatase [Bacteroidetes bacterium]|nr:CoA pyrophosphatase [Bacteroidota bacterium]